MSVVWLAGAIVCEVLGTVSLRIASEGRRAFLVPLAVCYPLAFFLLVKTLDAGMGIGVAYGIWTATGVALTALVSRVVFGERVTRMMAAGMALIAAGVLLIELGAQQ